VSEWRFGPKSLGVLTTVLGIVGTVQEVFGKPDLEIAVGSYVFNAWLSAAVVSLFATVAWGYVRMKRERDALLRRTPPDFRVHLGSALIDIPAILENNPSPDDLQPLERMSLYMPLQVFVTNRGPVPISLTRRIRASWKDGTTATAVPLDGTSGLRTWMKTTSGSNVALSFR
jgi:hypothetical protein